MRPRVIAGLMVAASPLLVGCVVATSSNRGGGGSFLFLLLPLIFFFVMVRSLRSRTRGRTRMGRGQEQRVRAQQAPSDLNMIRAELSVLADDVLRLETEVVLPEAARNDYESAVHRYRVAQAAMEQSGADRQIDLTRVQRVVDEAMWSMSRAKAIIQGYPPPDPPPKLQNPGLSGEPAVRISDDDRPAYVGEPVSFQSGWFGGGGGLLGGLLLGSMLGGFGGWVVHESSDDADSDGYQDGENLDA